MSIIKVLLIWRARTVLRGDEGYVQMEWEEIVESCLWEMLQKAQRGVWGDFWSSGVFVPFFTDWLRQALTPATTRSHIRSHPWWITLPSVCRLTGQVQHWAHGNFLQVCQTLRFVSKFDVLYMELIKLLQVFVGNFEKFSCRFFLSVPLEKGMMYTKGNWYTLIFRGVKVVCNELNQWNFCVKVKIYWT